MIPPHHRTFLTQLAKITARKIFNDYAKSKETKSNSGSGKLGNSSDVPVLRILVDDIRGVGADSKNIKPVLTNS